jgi:hypothetical protein
MPFVLSTYKKHENERKTRETQKLKSERRKELVTTYLSTRRHVDWEQQFTVQIKLV